MSRGCSPSAVVENYSLYLLNDLIAMLSKYYQRMTIESFFYYLMPTDFYFAWKPVFFLKNSDFS